MSESRSVPPPQLHFDDGSRIMAAAVSAPIRQHSNIRGNVSIETYYEVERLSQEIKNLPNNKSGDSFSCRVALQFPDELLEDAPEVSAAFSQTLGDSALVFVLGDTSFGACCCDEVSAQHLDASILVHYGHACLSPTSSLPVLYSFGVTEFDVQACVDGVQQQQQQKEQPENILLLYQVQYHRAMTELERQLRERSGINVVTGQIPQPQRRSDKSTNDNGHTGTANEAESTTIQEAEHPINNDTFVVGGLQVPSNIDLSSYTLFFVGDDNKSRQYVNIMLRFLSMPSEQAPSQYWTCSPFSQELKTSLPPFLQRQLNRRFYLTQKARDAHVYGILVGTLSQLHFQSVVSTIQGNIKDSGKTCYTLAVGKINGAKLANFAEIECFVLVACGEHSLLDGEQDLHVPVITPLELDIALGNTEWGSYSLDYNDFLSRQGGRECNVNKESGDDDDDAPYYSLVSGKYVDSKNSEGVDLTALPGRGQLAAYKSEASNFLRNRQYQGLEANIGKDEAHAAVPGQAGIASDYGNR